MRDREKGNIVSTFQPFPIIVLLQILQKFHGVGVNFPWFIFDTPVSSWLGLLYEDLLSGAQPGRNAWPPELFGLAKGVGHSRLDTGASTSFASSSNWFRSLLGFGILFGIEVIVVIFTGS